MITLENTKTIYDLICNAEREYGEKVFLRYEENDVIHEKTYIDLAKDCNKISAWVDKNNNKYGKKLHAALLGKSSYNYLTALLGVVNAGSVSIPLDVQLKKDDLIDSLNRSDTDVIFYDFDFNSEMEIVRENCPNIKEYICLQNINHADSIDLLLNNNDNDSFIPSVTDKDCAVIIFTSGTTGKSKGVMLSNGNLIDNTICDTEDHLREHETLLNVLPIHHIFCLTDDVLHVIRYGYTLCLANDLSKMLYYIKLFQPTTIQLVPMMAKILCNKVSMTAKMNPEMSLKEAKESVLGKNLYRIISGGGYLSESLSSKLLELDIAIGQGYGMSECSPTISTPDFDRKDKLSSVGKIVDRCHVRIVDGEIQVKSPSVMMGYYKDPERTSEVITSDGYLKTGDLGYVDDENFLYLTGRKKNLIILGSGENVSPESIENQFDNEMLISDILVYGEEDIIKAEIYPNYKYAELENIDDIKGAIQKIINKHNLEISSYKRISQFNIRKTPFEKTASQKIIRQNYFNKKSAEKAKDEAIHKPKNAIQQKIYDSIAEIIGNCEFGVDSDIYNYGLDSLGSVMLIEDLYTKFQKKITFNDLMENPTVLKLERFLLNEKNDSNIDLTPREVYSLTRVQKYFAYNIKGNTTSNMPFTFKLDNSIDLKRLKSAIEGTIDAHPGLKAIIKFDDGCYKIFRNDDRKIDIPIIYLSENEWKLRLQELLVPFEYTAEDNLFHIYIFKTESSKYLFFDVAHIMGDGMTMNVLFEDVNKLYCNKPIEKENYTFYEFILEEQMREKEGIKMRDAEYFNELMKNLKMQRSILNKKSNESYSKKEFGAISKRFDKLSRQEILNFCSENKISENALFLTAFNYCNSLFSGEKDVFCTSIHSGRTDNRWSRIAGPLFLTYYFRYKEIPHEKVVDLLQKSSRQIMNTMRCYLSTPREGEMFFQYQGDILNVNKIGDADADIIRLQLDSLPFHMQVMQDDKGYFMELRYWENRFDKKQLKIFISCYESIIVSMMHETSVRRLKKHLPAFAYPKYFSAQSHKINSEAGYDLIKNADEDEMITVYILDESYNKKPYAAWGPLYILDHKPDYYIDAIKNPYGDGTLYRTNITARILPDGTLDFLQNSGKSILSGGKNGRTYHDLVKLEKILCAYDGISDAKSYFSYDPATNRMRLRADVKGLKEINTENLMQYVKENCPEDLVPVDINYIGA